MNVELPKNKQIQQACWHKKGRGDKKELAPLMDINGTLCLAERYLGEWKTPVAQVTTFSGMGYRVYEFKQLGGDDGSRPVIGYALFKGKNSDAGFFVGDESTFEEIVKKYNKLGLRYGECLKEDSSGTLY